MQSRPLATTRLLIAFALLVALSAARPSAAASILYGDFGPVAPGVGFDDVQESSATDPVPLYGAPDLFAVGLDFDPTSFAATANGGAQDITDGQLNITLVADPSVAIASLGLFESGDYTLAGTGTTATQVLAGAILRAVVTQVNGIDVAPIDLSPVTASVGFDLASNAGVVQPWSLGLALDVASQLGAGQNATRIDLVIDDQLLAFSESSSLAFIAKKDFRIDVVTTVVPEPSALLLLLLGAGTAWRARTLRRRD